MRTKIRNGLARLDRFTERHMVPYGIIAYVLSLFGLIIPTVLFMASDSVPMRLPALVLLVLLLAVGLYVRSVSLLHMEDKTQKYVSIANSALTQLACIVMSAGSVLHVHGNPDATVVSRIGQAMAWLSILVGLVLVFWKELFHKNDDGPSGPVGMA